MSATATTSAVAPPEELSHKQILTILSGLILGMFLAALDQTIVSTAIKTIGNDLDDLSAQAWVTTSLTLMPLQARSRMKLRAAATLRSPTARMSVDMRVTTPSGSIRVSAAGVPSPRSI